MLYKNKYINMIKSFEQFINENYNENVVINTMCEEYGAPLFNEISESLIAEIHNSINEGKLVIDMNMVEEGLFDSVANLFKDFLSSLYPAPSRIAYV